MTEKRTSIYDRADELKYILSHKNYYASRLEDVTAELEAIEKNVGHGEYYARQQLLLQEAEHLIWCLLQYRRFKSLDKSVISKKEQNWVQDDVIERIEEKTRTQRRILTVQEALKTALEHWDA